jgi:hypothetical protein
MYLRLFFCYILFFLNNYTVYSQVQAKDTSKIEHKKNTFKPTTDFDQRFSFIRGSQVSIWGQKVGILINEKIKVGVGGYFLKDKLQGARLYNSSTPNFYVERNLQYGNIYIEPFLFRKSWWELSIPFEAGFGETHLHDYAVSNDVLIASGVKLFFPTGVGLSLSLKLPPGENWKPFRWVGINFLAGYRYDLDEHVYNTDYDGAFWSISGAIFLDRVFDDYKSWRKKRKEETQK